jgi:hypothetical protein
MQDGFISKVHKNFKMGSGPELKATTCCVKGSSMDRRFQFGPDRHLKSATHGRRHNVEELRSARDAIEI